MAENLLNSDFSYASLVNALNSAPVSVGPITKSNLFDLNPIVSTDVALELVDDQISLIQTSQRGGIGDIHPNTNRNMVKLKTSHVRTSKTMLADSWLNRSGFNQGGTPANVMQERDRVLREMSGRIRTTIDYMQAGALNGKILDADGSTIVDLFAEFEQTQQVVDFALDVAITDMALKVVAARRLSESALGMAFAESWVIFASAEFIDACRAHPSLITATSGWSAASVLTADHRDGTMEIAGARMIEVPNLAGKQFIPAGAAFLAPLGVAGLCTTHFAPADYIEAVGQPGLPMSAKAEELSLGKGLLLEAQSNPLCVVSRPRAIIRLEA